MYETTLDRVIEPLVIGFSASGTVAITLQNGVAAGVFTEIILLVIAIVFVLLLEMLRKDEDEKNPVPSYAS